VTFLSSNVLSRTFYTYKYNRVDKIVFFPLLHSHRFEKMGQMYPSTCQKPAEPRVHPLQRSPAHSNQNQLAPPLSPPLVSLLWFSPHAPQPTTAAGNPAPNHAPAQCWRRPSGRGLRSRPSPLPPGGAQSPSPPSLPACTTGPSSSPRPPREPAPPPDRETPRLLRSTRRASHRFVSWALPSSRLLTFGPRGSAAAR